MTISDDRGPRPDFESFTNDEVTNEDQIKNVLGIDDLPSIDLIEIYCNEMMTPDDIPATDNPTTLTIEPTADPTLNPESISTPGDLPDYEHNYDEPLLAKDVFQPRKDSLKIVSNHTTIKLITTVTLYYRLCKLQSL